ncbi:hypothetical protein LTR53_007365 [Teratosphaeriaceae sp. CCFEE 6253]|nr:hypothetical protein LTR53_007365 [Teratosphaeriaceae sp. CCFEE 6253]
MPEMIFVPNSSAAGPSTAQGPDTWFTGQVFIDKVHADANAQIANVMFTPCARTNWHTHEDGQLIRCIAGSGWICDKGASPKKLQVGDTVWCPPGTTHWHGADDGSYMVHFVLARGRCDWHDAVTDEEYAKKGQ